MGQIVGIGNLSLTEEGSSLTHVECCIAEFSITSVKKSNTAICISRSNSKDTRVIDGGVEEVSYQVSVTFPYAHTSNLSVALGLESVPAPSSSKFVTDNDPFIAQPIPFWNTDTLASNDALAGELISYSSSITPTYQETIVNAFKKYSLRGTIFNTANVEVYIDSMVRTGTTRVSLDASSFSIDFIVDGTLTIGGVTAVLPILTNLGTPLSGDAVLGAVPNTLSLISLEPSNMKAQTFPHFWGNPTSLPAKPVPIPWSKDFNVAGGGIFLWQLSQQFAPGVFGNLPSAIKPNFSGGIEFVQGLIPFLSGNYGTYSSKDGNVAALPINTLTETPWVHALRLNSNYTPLAGRVGSISYNDDGQTNTTGLLLRGGHQSILSGVQNRGLKHMALQPRYKKFMKFDITATALANSNTTVFFYLDLDPAYGSSAYTDINSAFPGGNVPTYTTIDCPAQVFEVEIYYQIAVSNMVLNEFKINLGISEIIPTSLLDIQTIISNSLITSNPSGVRYITGRSRTTTVPVSPFNLPFTNFTYYTLYLSNTSSSSFTTLTNTPPLALSNIHPSFIELRFT